MCRSIHHSLLSEPMFSDDRIDRACPEELAFVNSETVDEEFERGDKRPVVGDENFPSLAGILYPGDSDMRVRSAGLAVITLEDPG